MILGFTGSQYGMSGYQRVQFRRFITFYQTITEFHHGDCIGADKEAHNIVRELRPDIKIVGHPPTNPAKRAFCRCDEMREPKDYLLRNHDIVDESDELTAAPKSNENIVRSGTWATIRYAEEVSKPVNRLKR